MISDQLGRINDNTQVSKLSTVGEIKLNQAEKGTGRWAEPIPILKKLNTSFLE